VDYELPFQPVMERDGLRQGLTELRGALLGLHKALIESERVGYEKTFGRIASPYQFLHLLTSDAWFAWLRPVSQLITAMDEILEAEEPLTAAGAEVLSRQARALLVASAGADGFSGHYDEALQRDPDVVLAHAAAARCFRTGIIAPERARGRG